MEKKITCNNNHFFKKGLSLNKKITFKSIKILALLLACCVQNLQAQTFIHPGGLHNQADLDRMKYMVQAKIEPYFTSYNTLKADPKSSATYAVQGNPTLTVLFRDAPGTNLTAWYSDANAAYYNALMWAITGDSAHAKKSIEIFTAWSNLTQVQGGGTESLNGGLLGYLMIEAAEIIQSTYSGWNAIAKQKFKDMLVYPGYSNTAVPASLSSTNGTFYWRIYKFDSGRHGNQELAGMRTMLTMGVFLDNKIMYDRALNYLKGLPHRSDDLPYDSGPSTNDGNISGGNSYNDVYNNFSQASTTADYGYNGVLNNYIWENGQCQESSRDQGHSSLGESFIQCMDEIAWHQGEDIWSFNRNHLLQGLNYLTRYNVSSMSTYPDQPSPWEPTAASGEYIQRLDRTSRWYSKRINPFTDLDTVSVTRGATSVTPPVWEMAVAHYGVRQGLSSDSIKWITRARDVSINLVGYESHSATTNDADHPGYGALTCRRPQNCAGDPISSIASGKPVYKMNVLPATIEAENFDFYSGNGEGHTYHDLSSGNSSGQYRTDADVDVETCSEGGYNLNGLENGEWINYTVSVPVAGHYKLNMRYATSASGATVDVQFGGIDKTGTINMPFGDTNSTGSQVWKTFTIAQDVTLQAGVQSMRLFIGGTSNILQINNFQISLTAALTTQTISFSALPIKNTGIADFDPGATASSGLPVIYSTLDTTVATIVNGLVHIVGAGTAIITASQTGNDTYASAADVNQVLNVTGIAAGDYVSSGNMNWNGGIWNISDGAGGIASTTTTPPTATNNVNILAGHTVTLSSTAANVQNLTVYQGATLLQQAALTIAQTTVVSGTETMSSTLTVNDLTIDATGVVASTTAPQGSVSSLITSSPRIININGQLGAVSGSPITNIGSGIRIFVAGTGTTTFTGSGTVNIARFSPNSNNTANQNIIIDMDMEIRNYAGNNVASLTLQNGNMGNGGKILTINGGKTVKINGSGLGAFHGVYWPAYGNSAANNSGSNMTYNINGTLDCSSDQFNLVTNQQTAANTIVVNINGRLKLGSTVRMFRYLAAQNIYVNVSDNGIVDGSTSALNLNASTSGQTVNTSNFTGVAAVPTGLGGVALSGGLSPIVGSYTFTGSGGSGYITSPTVIFTGGTVTSTQAANAVATLTNGIVTGITVISTGSYTVAPTGIQLVGGGAPTQWLSINGANATGIVQQLVGAGITTPFWLGIGNFNYNPVTVNPATGSLFTIGVVQGNSPTGLPEVTHSLARTWNITPVTPSVTTIGLSYNNTDGNASFDGNRNQFLMHYNNGTSAWETIGTSVSPTIGIGTDKMVTYNNVSSFSPFTITNDQAQQSQTITFPAISTKVLGAADFDPGATASSGLQVTYASSNTAVATIVGNLIHVVGVGNATITASQAGNGQYVVAPNATQTLTVTDIAAGDYFSSGSMIWNGGTWNIGDGAGGIASSTTTAPGSTNNVHILSGHTVTLATTAASIKNLTVDAGGILTQQIGLIMSGTTAVSGTITTTNTLTVSDLSINASGVISSTTAPAGTVYSLITNSATTININGRLGATSGSAVTATGSGIRIFVSGTGTTTFTGTGVCNIARLSPNSANTAAQNIVIDMDMEIRNYAGNGVASLTLQNGNTASGAKVLTINAGKTVKINGNNGTTNLGAFHGNYWPAYGNAAAANTGTSMTYNINGTLDCSAAQFNLVTNTQTAGNAIVLNVNGTLKLGPTVRLFRYLAGQSILVNVGDNGVIDESSVALNQNAATTGQAVNTSNFTGTAAVPTGLGGISLSGNNPVVGSYTFSGTGGSGYTTPPTVLFTGGTVAANQTAATAIATLTNGSVTGISVLSSGASTYSAAPTGIQLVGGGVPTQWFAINGANQTGLIKQLVNANTSTPFWIGPTTTSYNPLSINPATGSVFTVNILQRTNPATLPNVSQALNRTWNITPATASATAFTFGYNAADANAGCNPANAMSLMHYNSTTSAWEVLGSTATPAAGIGTDKIISFSGISSFSPFTLINNSAVLPVTLLSFMATPNEKTVNVFWTTTEEINAKGFEILRSVDGKNFQTIGIQTALGSSTTLHNYQFNDANPSVGTNYYQLKIIDNDGSVTFSKIVSVVMNATQYLMFKVYPNPAQNNIIVLHPVASVNAFINIYVADGRLISSNAVGLGSNQTNLNVANLAAGKYTVTFLNNGVTTGCTFIK